jgi:hypothetical protein
VSDFNPYAAPQSQLSARARDFEEPGAWRDGNLLAMTKGFDLPDRCLKCNLPANGWRLKRDLSWHSPIWFVLVAVSPLIYIIVAMIVRKTGKAAIPLCPAHRRRRRNAILVGWLTALLGILVIFAGAAMTEHSEYGVIGGALLLLFGVVYGVVRSQVAVPQRIDKRLIWLKKVHPDFLAELPPLVTA